jgi:hypothetical protein
MFINKEVSKILDVVIKDCYSMNTDRQWAVINMRNSDIMLDFGVIHSNGMYEQAIGTRMYYIDSNDVIKFTLHTHR